MFNPQTASWQRFAEACRMASLGHYPLETVFGRMWVRDDRHPLLKAHDEPPLTRERYDELREHADDMCRRSRLGRHGGFDD